MLDFRDMQVKELSAKTGISKNTIDNYLSGQKSLPNIENGVKIASALNVTVEYLVTGKNASEPPLPPTPVKYQKILDMLPVLDDTDLASVSALLEHMQKRYQ